MGFYYAMCYIYSMLDKNSRPINNYQNPSMVNRLGAALLDLVLFIIASIVILTASGYFVGQKGTAFSHANETISEQIINSKLAKDDGKNGYVAYQSNELLALDENDQSTIINYVAYFYLHYLTGEGVDANLAPSLDKDVEIKTKEGNFLPKDYYTVSYFNEVVLGLPKPGVIADNLYFVYAQKDNENDYTKIGVIKDEFYESTTVDGKETKHLKNVNGLGNRLNKLYSDAIDTFYSQKSIKSANNLLNTVNTILMLVSTLPSLAIFYILIPLLSPFGQTLGKRLLSVAVTDSHGYLVKKWRMLLRVVPLLGVTIYICVFNVLYYQLLVSLLAVLISTGILVFSPRRRALHDLVAGTTAIKLEKDTIIYPNEERYQQALEIMKERAGVQDE